jgi:RNA polymerase sigma-70 factor (ECF subfamily)
MEKDILLINETLQGNNTSFRVLVEKYQDYVFSIAFKVLKNREEAEEAAQDAFVKAYRALASFGQRSKFATWLYQIAWRTAVDRYRARPAASQSLDNDRHFLQIKDETATPAQQLQRQNLQKLIQRELDRMKPEDAALMNLYYLQEQTVKEISDITGLTESNVKVKLFRLRDALKTQLTAHLKKEVKDLL